MSEPISQSSVPFPLTPALSPEERENHPPRYDQSRRSDILERRTAWHPLLGERAGVSGNWSHVVSTGSGSAMALTLPRTLTPPRSFFVASFTLYGATKIVAWATRLLADRAESFGGREGGGMFKVPNWNLEARSAH